MIEQTGVPQTNKLSLHYTINNVSRNSEEVK